jgi:hypothetical protein
MRTRKLSTIYLGGVLGLAGGALFLSGCGVQTSSLAPVAVTNSIVLHGSVHGGQQPVANSTVQLYATGTGGYGSASYSLLTQAVTTDTGGNFSITGDYTCPSSTSQVYITSTGGDSGSGNNPNLALMAALGACSNLTPTTFISINEVTTVGSVWALAPFMSGPANVGASATNSVGLTNAFASVNKLANVATGSSLGSALPAGAVAPVAEIDTLADILAACVNSQGGTAGAGNACGTLFAAATPSSGSAPTDTITAALNIAKAPGRNVTALFGLSSPTAPFQPTLASAPNDWTISVTYNGGGLNKPSAAALDLSGNLWVTNQASNSVTVLGPGGGPVLGSPLTGGGLNGPSSIAIAESGSAWIANKSGSSVTAISASGVPFANSPFQGGGLSAPTGVSIDGLGFIWVTNSGNSTVTKLDPNGGVLSGFGYSGGGITSPAAIAINPR